MSRLHAHSRVGVSSIGTARGVTLVKRDRPVSSLTVPCPQCGVEPGDLCATRRPGDVHPSRRRMAVRLLNEMTL